MLSGIYEAAAAISVAEQRQEIIANNLAHINVPGFRRSDVVVQTFEAALNETGAGTDAEPITEVVSDFTEGPALQTGRSLDVAIMGDGFFVLEGPEGPLYTRNGVFQLSADGELVNSTGLKVEGAGGPIRLPGNASPGQVEISDTGAISVAGVPAGELRIVQFPDNRQLEIAGTTLFSAPAGVVPAEADVLVRQGAREQSNVAPVIELVQMIVNMRQHEAAERVLKSLDESLQMTTNPQG